MGVFGKIKQAFGFGGDEFEEDSFGIDATVVPLNNRKGLEDSDSQDEETRQASLENDAPFEEVEQEIVVPVDRIFDSVVVEFNKSLPGFLQSGVNADAQRQHLYEGLESDIREYLENVKRKALEQCNRRWERERVSLNNEVKSLREQARSHSENDAEKTKQLLSAERQKRAMNERIHDLEDKIANLEAEKDQYELETRSLVNKLRVSNMLNEGVEVPDISEYEKRIDALTIDNQSLTEKLSETNATIDELNAKIVELSSIREALENEKKDLDGQLESLRIKADMSDVMLNDLNSRASSANKEITERDSEIEGLKARIEELSSLVDDTQSQLDEAHANLEIAATIGDEVERIQQAIEKKNGIISELNVKLRQRDDRVNALEAEEASLKHTIEANILAQAENEKALREQIANLEHQLSTSHEKNRSKRRQSVAKISAIDEDLDNTDWLVATPPEGTPIKTSGVSDAEFGYQEPQRKTPPENSAQMSLW